MKWIAYCRANDGKVIPYYQAFEFEFESDLLPRDDDEICIEQGKFCCEMKVLGCTWLLLEGKLVPTVQLEPGARCSVADFIGLGWKSA